jgi:aldose 1-epimerase
MQLSGEQIAIASGAHRAMVTSVGATLRSYTVAGTAVIDGFEADEVCPGGRGQLLLPWPNRIAQGRYEFAGRRQQLPIDEVELGHAIHGLSRWCDWRVEARGDDHARLSHRVNARPGYPFQLELSVEYRVSSSGLTVTVGATNIGEASCPFGAGAHPYFRFEGARADAVELCVRAAEWLEVDSRSIPTRHREIEGSAVDFRRARLIGASQLDQAFTGLERDRDGLAQVLLCAGERELRVWLDRSFGFVQVYTGDTLPDRARRRLGIAVEPMTCAPDAFNSGDGLIVLPAGGSFEGRWGISTQAQLEVRSGR